MEPCKTTIKGRQVKTHAVNTAKMVGLPSASFLCWLDMFFSDGTSCIWYTIIVSSVFIVEGVFFNAFQTVRISHQFLYQPKAGVGREGSCFAQEAKQRFEIEIVQIYGLADPLRLKESRKDWSCGSWEFSWFCVLIVCFKHADLFINKMALEQLVELSFFPLFSYLPVQMHAI